ncbi:MAG: hypothetical protein QF828_00055, partial [Pseudomonadales bacterium]|nr:hypothetical protein [Pseudomonadales bacterium]
GAMPAQLARLTPSATGFVAVLDESTAVAGVDVDSVTAALDGAKVDVFKSKTGALTTITYDSGGTLMAPESEHTLVISFVDANGASQRAASDFKVKPYTVIDTALKLPDSAKGDSGFTVFPSQISTGQAVTSLVANWAAAEQQIRGGFIDPDTEEPYLNEADIDSFDLWSFSPVGVETVNQNQDAPDSTGSFKDTNGYEDEPLSGIPGWDDSTDGVASEYVAMLQLDKGAYTLGVNANDGFNASFGVSYADAFQQNVGDPQNRKFDIYVGEAGLYPFRVLFWENTGPAHIEIYSMVDGERVLINDPDVAGSIKAFAPKGVTLDETTTDRAATGRAYIESLSPVADAFGTDKNIRITLVNGSLTSLNEGSVKFSYDGEVVSHSVDSDGDVRVISYDATSAGNGAHTALVEFADSAGHARSIEWSFTLANPVVEGEVNLLAHWGFDEELDAVQSIDSVAGMTADLLRGARITTDSIRGNALDASAAANSYATADGAFLNLTSPLNQFSFTFWSKWVGGLSASSHFWARSTSSPSGERGAQAHVPWGGGNIFWDTSGCCGGADTRINMGWGGDYHSWNHFAFTKNGDTKQIYINGELFHEGENTAPINSDFHTLNIMGDQNGGNSPNAIMDDFAVFGSALESEQLADVMTGKLLGANEASDLIAVQPTDATAEVNSTATFSLGLANEDLSVLWKMNGVIIGSGASIETAVLSEVDDGSTIQATVMSSDSYQLSDEVTLTVTPDTTPPSIVSTDSSFLMDSLTIVFNEDMADPDASSFSIDGLSVEGAELDLDGDRTVIISTGIQTVNQVYTVTISGLEDAGGNALNTSVDIQAKYFALVDGEPNLIMFYDFDNDAIAGRAFDNVFDTIGTVNGAAMYTDDTPTDTGKAMDLTTGGGYVHIADADLLNIASAIDELSISFWQKNYTIPSTSSFYANSRTVERAFQAHVPWSNGQIYWDTVGCCDGGTQRINADANGVGGWGEGMLETWHHYVFIKSGETKEIWIDGDYFHDGVNTLPLPTDIYNFAIGSYGNGANSVSGVIDDFAVFASTLTEDQILALSEGDRDLLPGPQGGPILISAEVGGLAGLAS